jgi:hypothetical protein
MIHTGRVAAVANVLNLNVTDFHQRDGAITPQERMPYLANKPNTLMIISQVTTEKPVRYWSSAGKLDSGSVWTRCGGKLASTLFDMRLVELKL